jgi:MarR family transcriptional regulator, 2-MHQ and catechol-resistance regulon repressor
MTTHKPLSIGPLAAPPESASLKLWVVLSKAYQAVYAFAEADVARHGLSMSEFAILEALYHKGPLLLGDLQRRILVSSGGVTYLVDRLTTKGLVERMDCASDRRARYAKLTDQGAELIATIFPEHQKAIEDATSSLSGRELQQLTAQLRSLGREIESKTESES